MRRIHTLSGTALGILLDIADSVFSSTVKKATEAERAVRLARLPVPCFALEGIEREGGGLRGNRRKGGSASFKRNSMIVYRYAPPPCAAEHF